MKRIFAVACLTVLAAGAFAAEREAPAPDEAGRSSVFAELQALGFDLGRFRPDGSGRYPYR